MKKLCKEITLDYAVLSLNVETFFVNQQKKVTFMYKTTLITHALTPIIDGNSQQTT
jgi:hypothetical protein